MENTNRILAENIQKYRKEKGFTQEELAEKLGVTFQAVSKWENARSAPDIFLLPIMADIFDCKIDELFSKEHAPGIDIPFEDDGIVRIFQAVGNKIMKTQEQDSGSNFEVEFPKNCNETTRQYFKVEVYGNIVSEGAICGDVVCYGDMVCNDICGDMRVEFEQEREKHSVIVHGDVAGGCYATGDLTVGGSVAGGCNSGGDMEIALNVNGGVNATKSVTISGELRGGCNCMGEVNCTRDVYGDINAGNITVHGNIEADKLRGNVVCYQAVNCDNIEGDVNIIKE
ncbi:MAG: helix-turn-helix domain-containing protein [Clostridia bacterium]|nr:helix-turn-helix domain-containing protein [Clostridia bacterium]